MPLTYRIARQGSDLTLSLSGTLGLNDNDAFRKAVEEVAEAAPRSVQVDLGGLSTLDSAGLSMLVVLRNRVSRLQARVSIRQPPEHIRRLLEVVEFDKLFEVDAA
jgi:anti-sigma B factor antagonist